MINFSEIRTGYRVTTIDGHKVLINKLSTSNAEWESYIKNQISESLKLNSFNYRTDAQKIIDWISGRISEHFVSDVLGTAKIKHKHNVVSSNGDNDIVLHNGNVIEVKSSMPFKSISKIEDTITRDMSLFVNFTTQYRKGKQYSDLVVQVLVYGLHALKKNTSISSSDFIGLDVQVVLAGVWIRSIQDTYKYNEKANINKTAGQAIYRKNISPLTNATSFDDMILHIKKYEANVEEK